MKKNMIYFVNVVLVCSFVLSQERVGGELEINITPPSSNPTIEMYTVGTVWYGIINGLTEDSTDYSICTDNQYLSFTLNGANSRYFDFITVDRVGSGETGTILHGQYRFRVGNDSIDIDWRDSDFYDLLDTETWPYGAGYNNQDIKIRWHNTGQQWQYYGITGWDNLANGTVLHVWDYGWKDIVNYPPHMNYFQPTNPTSLTKLSDSSGHPRFEWNESEPSSSTYNVWRKLGIGLYTKIASNQPSNTYIDYTVSTSHFGQDCRYKINAENGSNSSAGYSNIILYSVWNSREMVERLELPLEFRLQQNYPNPFNPVTTIMYDLPEYSRVIIKIYNTLGQLVATPLNDDLSAGYRALQWNGTGDNANAVASGVYLYTISAQSLESDKTFTDKKKMLLLK